MQPPSCAGCGQPLTGSFVTALGRRYHPQCFTCADCGRPISGQFQLYAERPYHPDCFRANHLPRCGYCRTPLEGQYLIDAWGTPFCPHHKQEWAACSYCGRLEPHVPLTRRTRRQMQQQTVRCAACALSAVETAAAAEPVAARVIAALAADGVRLRDRLFRLRLLPEAEFVALEGHVAGRMGLTHSTHQTRNGKTERVTIDFVAILAGLPRVLFEAVLAHELGHVWLIQHGVRGLSRRDEEGFCELLAHRHLTALGGVEAGVYARGIAANADPIYGDGYRALAALSARVGFAPLVEGLRSKRALSF